MAVMITPLMGVNITAFVASLGVGGVAVALAVQSILSDLFASLAIGLDKPFEIGDFIVFGEIAGSIEHIGLKTTRIRSLSGEQIVCSNTELLKNTIHNYKRMAERRILFNFGVTYDANPEQLRAVPAMAALCEAHTAWTDTRVSQQTIKTTICRRGHLAEVMPSFDEQMRLKAGLLEQRNIPAESATAYALDFRMDGTPCG